MQPQPHRRMIRTLREFEGWRCLWRVPASAALFAAVPLFLIGVSVGAMAIAGDDFDLDTGVVAAVVSVVGSTFLYPQLVRGQLHRRLIATRLATWESPNPATSVPLLIREPHIQAATHVLRRAGFNPGVTMLRLTATPTDARDLDVQLRVEEPAAHPQSSSDEDRVQRVAHALDVAGIRARVAGVDVPHSLAA